MPHPLLRRDNNFTVGKKLVYAMCKGNPTLLLIWLCCLFCCLLPASKVMGFWFLNRVIYLEINHWNWIWSWDWPILADWFCLAFFMVVSISFRKVAHFVMLVHVFISCTLFLWSNLLQQEKRIVVESSQQNSKILLFLFLNCRNFRILFSAV